MKKEEIERRFLLYPCRVKSFLKKNFIKYELLKIKQFYLPSLENEAIRYRKENGKYIKTVKRGEGLKREEIEKRVSKKEFRSFLKKRLGRVIKKRRYKAKLGGTVYEIDEFKGFLKGLSILEAEFENETEALRFKPVPPVSGIVSDEITSLRKFSNKALSLSSFIPSLKCEEKEPFVFFKKDENFYKASLSFEYHPFYCLRDLLRISFYRLYGSVSANTEAILSGDEDAERLHQFRVALRKTRTFLSLFSPFFKKDFAKKLEKELSFVMKKTNAKRDADVYVEKIAEYEKILPEEFKNSLESFKESLFAVRRKESEKLKNFLKSSKTRKSLRKIERLFFASVFKEKSLSPSVISVKKLLKKRYEKILKKADGISLSSSSKEFHKIRIEFKKLRYLSEMLSLILDAKEFERWRKRLKEIQTVLGEHQDLVVERERLKILFSIEEKNDEKSRKAVSYLRKSMKKEIMKKRELFIEKFNVFKKEGEEFLNFLSCPRRNSFESA